METQPRVVKPRNKKYPNPFQRRVAGQKDGKNGGQKTLTLTLSHPMGEGRGEVFLIPDLARSGRAAPPY